MTRVLLIAYDDWEGIYVENRLMDEDHKLDHDQIVAYVTLVDQGEYRELFYDNDNAILDSYADEHGYLHRLPPEFIDGEFNELWQAASNYWEGSVRRALQRAGIIS